MDNVTDRFDFQSFSNGTGNSGFGQAHGPGIDLRPTLPTSTPQLTGVDLSDTLYTSEVAVTGGPKVAGGNGNGHGGPPPPSTGGGSYADYTSNVAGSAYNVTVHFNGSNWTVAEHQAFVDAANRISSLITGDVPNVTVISKAGIQVVDDILFTAELKTIDGVGGILGQSGPTSIRTVGSLPATATMQFDSADAQAYVDTGQFGVIVLHEMLHGVGFGTVWSYLNLTSGSTFVGAHAEAEYGILIGAGPTAVPLETGGGSGTAGSHWSEALFNHELMTGYIDALPDPLSKMTVASLQDLGYQVNYAGPIDGYALG
ncbi:MAG: leishmanolysin-related zinc metalloendopeptidase [Phenylobacterium sp.]